MGETAVEAEFVVIDSEKKQEALLGRETAVQLGVLKLGVPVYSVKSEVVILCDYEEFFESVGKLRSYQVKLHVDPDDTRCGTANQAYPIQPPRKSKEED